MSNPTDISEGAQWVEGTERPHVEQEGIEAGQILGFVIMIAFLIGLVVVALFQYTDLTAQEVLVEATDQGVYPELDEIRLHATVLLTQYEALAGTEGRYRIPIVRAMELMAQEAPVHPEEFYAPEYMATYRER